MASSSEPMMINCKLHGEQVSALICTHMRCDEPAPAGFIQNIDDPNDLQAWCHRCEDKFTQEDGMTEAFQAFNAMIMVCVACYLDAKKRHTLPPT